MKANLKEIRGWKFILAMAGLFLMLLLVPPAQADKYWVGPNPDENWSTADNWSTTAGGGGGAGEPTDGETA